MNKEKVLALADMIESSRKRLEMEGFLNTCGTAACIAGFAFVAERGQSWRKSAAEYWSDWGGGISIPEIAQEYLELTEAQADELFYVWKGPPLDAITREQAVETLRYLAQTGKVNWKRAAKLFPAESAAAAG